VRAVLRPLHAAPVTRRASVDDAKPEEFAALVDACEHWRDRFLLGVMYFGGLRQGEALGLRLADLHFAESSAELGCRFPGPHLHVVPRANPNGARVKGERRPSRSTRAWSAHLIFIYAASATSALRPRRATSCS
jgi:integrase/recombinase XerD